MDWTLYWTIVIQAGLALMILAVPVYLFISIVWLAIHTGVKAVRRAQSPDIRNQTWSR